jgi:hypothetical protein
LDLSKIIHLSERPPEFAVNSVAKLYFKELISKQFKAPSPRSDIKGSRQIDVIAFEDIEQFLLQKVRRAMNGCRNVSKDNHYSGNLSKMLFLFDAKETPYLPRAITYSFVNRRLRRTEFEKKIYTMPTIFERLGITMPVNGKVEIAEIDTHDPRRWLTTQALRHGEKLSDVLINKWANRLKLAQLKAYDLRSDEELAYQSRMPESSEIHEISKGIEQANRLEDEFGLKSEIVTVHNAGISVASMDQITQSVEDRPTARTSEQVIILYPSQYGCCLHQHHETPCRNYDSCLPCDENIVVKGHIPTNDKIRSRSELLQKSIIRQIERLALEHNRNIADDSASLAMHMVLLIERGLDHDQIADHMIDEFHEIRDLIKDKLLAKRLEEAFVAKGFVKRLDSNEVASGALIKYHNPSYHGSPGLEKALDSHGGRKQIGRDEQELITKFPQFSPKALGLKDERSLLEPDDEEGKD